MGILKVGDVAPEIDAAASDGHRFVLSQQTGLCTVVYFFPKAFTPGCTGEAKRFGDNYNEILLAGAQIVGISTDDADTQCRFADSLRAPFPMIGDADRSIARRYGVLWPLIGLPRRVTFVINPQRIIEAVFRHEIRIVLHRDEVLRFIHTKLQARQAPR